MTAGTHWAVAQTVNGMEGRVLRELENANHGGFLPTYVRHWKVDGRPYTKEYPLFGGYVFFQIDPDHWAGLPDIHGVYRVLFTAEYKAARVTETEMTRLMLAHAKGTHNRTDPAKFTKYYRSVQTSKRNSRKPRPSKRLRGFVVPNGHQGGEA